MTGIVVGSGYSAFQTFLQQLPTDFTAPSGSLFPTPTINGQPITGALAPSGAIKPLQLSTTEVAVSFAGPPTDYLLFEGSGLSFPLNGTSLSSLGGTVSAAQLYSGGTFTGGAVTGGTLLASLTFSASQYVLTAGGVSLTLSGADLPTAAATVQAIAQGTYSGGPIGISQIQAVDGATTVTLGVTASALSLSVVNPGAGANYALTLTGAFPTALTAAQIDALVKGSGFTASGPVGLTGIQYTSNGYSASISLSPTILQVTAGDYQLTLTVTFPSLSLTADQLTTLVGGGSLPPLGGGAVTSAVVTQVSTGAVVESVTSPTSGGLPFSDLHFQGGDPSAFVQYLFNTLALVFKTEVVSAGQSWTISGASSADTNDVVLAGGFEVVQSGGTTLGVVVSSGGRLAVQSGATADNVTVLSGGAIAVFDGANVNNLNVEPGGAYVSWHEVASGQTYDSIGTFGGVLVDAGGAISAVTAFPGGVILDYGLAQGTWVSGYEQVGSGGVDGSATIAQFGSQLVQAGGSASQTQVQNGGRQEVAGAATRVLVMSGGREIIDSGGTVSGLTVNSGATVLVHQGATLSNVYFTGGGVLNVAAGATVQGLVANPGLVIDVAVSSATATVTSTGQLLVSGGGKLVETIGLTGPQAPGSIGVIGTGNIEGGGGASLAGLAVSLHPDGKGGTDIVFASESFLNLQIAMGASVIGSQTTIADYAPGGAFLGSEVITDYAGGAIVTQYLNSAGAQYDASIQQNLGGGATETQDFDGAWRQKDAVISIDFGSGSTLVEYFDGAFNHTSAVFTQTYGATTVVQHLDGAWNLQSATLTTVDAADHAVITENVNSAWTETTATIAFNPTSTSTVTQAFGAGWVQTGATIVNQATSAFTETQHFDANWNQTAAEIVQHPDGATTEIQRFDGTWNQLSADIITVSGNVTTDQEFKGAWNFTGATTTTILTGTSELVQTYDASWNHVVGADHVIVQAAQQAEVFNGSVGLPVTFVFAPGDINGDALTGFINAAANPNAHDVLQFVGYGPGAALTQIDASHWQITAPGRAAEIFTLAGGLNPAAGDVVFS